MKTVSSIIVTCILALSLPSYAALAKVNESGKSVSGHSKNSISLNIGLASALGFTGIAYSRNLSKNFQLEAGAGLGFSGVQLSLMPKLTLGSGKHRFVSGLGLSVGLPSAGADDGIMSLSKTPSLWLNCDIVGYQLKSSPTNGKSSFFLLAAIGLTVGLAGEYHEPDFCFGPSGACAESSADSRESFLGKVLPTFRLGIGVAF